MDYKEPVEFVLGKKSSDYLLIETLNYADPNSNDYWDGNWLNTYIELKVGGFNGNYKAQIRNDEFQNFRNGLEYPYNKLDGRTNFECIEHYISIQVEGDGLGHFQAKCTANDNPGIYENTLEFSIEFDQTEIPGLINMLDDILKQFPIKASEHLKDKRQ